MEDGILYLSDETGETRFVQIDLSVHGGEWLEDFVDVLVAESRRGGESVPLAEALAELRRAGKLAAAGRVDGGGVDGGAAARA